MKNIIEKLKSISADLYQHFSIGVILFMISYAFFCFTNCPVILRAVFSLFVVLAVAFEKETIDKKHTGFNWRDIFATVIGGIIVFIVKVLL